MCAAPNVEKFSIIQSADTGLQSSEKLTKEELRESGHSQPDPIAMEQQHLAVDTSSPPAYDSPYGPGSPANAHDGHHYEKKNADGTFWTKTKIIVAAVTVVAIIAVAVTLGIVLSSGDGGGGSSSGDDGSVEGGSQVDNKEAGSIMASLRVTTVSADSDSSKQRTKTKLSSMSAQNNAKISRMLNRAFGMSKGHGPSLQAYDDADTDYSKYKTATETQSPGQRSMDTINGIICFLSVSGGFSVLPETGTFISDTDLNGCFNNGGGGEDSGLQVKQVIVYDVEHTEILGKLTVRGSIFFDNRGDFWVDYTLELYYVDNAFVCPGSPVENSADTANTYCWVGEIVWKGADGDQGQLIVSYDSGSDLPISFSFFETGSREEIRFLATTDRDSEQVRGLLRTTETGSSPTFICFGAVTGAALFGRGSSAEQACNPNGGGWCPDRTQFSLYPQQYAVFDGDTGALEEAESDFFFELEKLGQRVYLSIARRGMWLSVDGSGEAQSGHYPAEGETVADRDGVEYTVHYASARIESYTLNSITLSEFANKNRMLLYIWDSVRQRTNRTIIRYVPGTSTATMWEIERNSYWNQMSSDWSSFESVTGERIDLSNHATNNRVLFYMAEALDLYYTQESQNNYQFIDWRQGQVAYDISSETIFTKHHDGIFQPGEDKYLICTTQCKRVYQYEFSGTTYSYCGESYTCPMTDWGAVAANPLRSEYNGNVSFGDTGNGYDSSTNAVYRYLWKGDELRLYAYQDNDGNALMNPVIVDAVTGVNWTSNYGFEFDMFEGSDSTLFDTPEELAAYLETNGNTVYKVSLGPFNGPESFHNTFTVFPKLKSNSEWQTIQQPITCTVTMSTATDANGGTEFDGASFDLSFYKHHTEGLRYFEVQSFNSDVGQDNTWRSLPQIADGALCVGTNKNYRLKAAWTSIEFAEHTTCPITSLVSPGNLPTGVSREPNNFGEQPPTASVTCIELGEFTSEAGCVYVAGMTNTAG